MNRAAARLIALLLVGAAVVVAVSGREGGDVPSAPGIGVTSLLGDADAPGLRRADPGYRPEFPRDHGPHPGFRSEWWYFTGNLSSPDGGRFGFQFTIFRFALGGHVSDRGSRWATDQAWMGHLAVTDAEGGRFHRAERFARGGSLGLAGAAAAPFSVWIGDWRMEAVGATLTPMTLSARAGDFGIRLRLGQGRGPVMQGEDGYSRKGPGEGNASHYYSYPRLPVSGELLFDGGSVPVTGEAWLDREWSTSALGPDVSGWDWFALQLDDGSELMYYRLRRDDGTADPLSAGTLTDPEPRRLDAAAVVAEPTRYWRSPDTGARYPVGWRLEVPSHAMRLELEPLLDGQEMDLSVDYWEGAVRVSGTRSGEPLAGYGYLEMTGYPAARISP